MSDRAETTATLARWARDDALARARLAGGMTADRLGWSDLQAAREEWKALAAGAAEPNVFLDPDYALAVLPAIGLADRLEALAVRRAGRLVGLFPFVRRRRWGVPVAVGEALVQPYGPSAMPLVAADAVEDTVEAFLDWLSTDADAPAAWLFRLLPGDGPVDRALRDALAGRGMAAGDFAAHGRAVFEASAGPEWLAGALPKKARKEFARLERRLAERGEVVRTTAREPADIAGAIAEFLALEAAGWKGRRGTAAASQAATAEMFQAATAALSANAQCRVDALRLDGRPVAMTISLGCGESWWLWKIAYDEGLANVSPGVRLVIALTDEVAAGGHGHWDSCALPGIGMIERLWRARRPYSDLLIVSGTGGIARAAPLLERARRSAEQAAKALRDRLRG